VGYIQDNIIPWQKAKDKMPLKVFIKDTQRDISSGHFRSLAKNWEG